MLAEVSFPILLSKYIYDRRFILADAGHIDFKDDGWYYKFYMKNKAYLSIDIRHGRPPAFVVEQVWQNYPYDPVKPSDCLNDVSPSLKKWVRKCEGELQVRELNEEEKEQMQAFIENPQGRSF